MRQEVHWVNAALSRGGWHNVENYLLLAGTSNTHSVKVSKEFQYNIAHFLHGTSSTSFLLKEVNLGEMLWINVSALLIHLNSGLIWSAMAAVKHKILCYAHSFKLCSLTAQS